jgi:hypothetical protein
MAVFLGNRGSVRLRRASKNPYGVLADTVIPDDIAISLNRFSFDSALDNLLTGDRIDLGTQDPRGLIFIDGFGWSDGQVRDTISAFIHVNAMGGLRLFRTFTDAINNNRAAEIPLVSFAGEPVDITIKLRDVNYNVLGDVRSYTFSNDREAIDTTVLSDRFRHQFSAGLISGSGTLDCLFNYKTTGIQEPSLLMLQLIQRVDIGSEFDLNLYLTDQEIDPNVETIFYDVSAMVTRAGVQVAAGDMVQCSIDFVTTGDIRLLIGRPSDYILKEDDDRIGLEQSLDFLLQEVTD